MDLLIRPTILKRSALLARYRANRQRSAKLFDLVRDAMYERPLSLRHPFVFYLGHIPAFHFNTLAKRALGEASFEPVFDDIFRRGIDPETSDDARSLQALWPAVEAVESYARRIDARMEELILHAKLDDAENRYLQRAEALYTVLEHEEMHQETLIYILTCLDDAKKHLGRARPYVGPVRSPLLRRVTIPGGIVTLGADRNELAFGWDNEFDRTRVQVADFELESLPVTNGRYLACVEAGAKPPVHWIQVDGRWMQRTLYGLVPLQHAWPVYVSFDDAQAFAQTQGARIMSEAEFQRAAFGDPSGVERSMPWGEAAPSNEFGNFGFTHVEPVPVGSYPAGASAWGVHELVGNGWEWTSTAFEALPGFTPMASYPEYSADFFDGKHTVLKGASPVTACTLLRPSLRNWFRRDYDYAYSKFRLAY